MTLSSRYREELRSSQQECRPLNARSRLLRQTDEHQRAVVFDDRAQSDWMSVHTRSGTDVGRRSVSHQVAARSHTASPDALAHAAVRSITSPQEGHVASVAQLAGIISIGIR